MASPQCEHGHVRIANELFEAILGADFSKRELLVLLAVIRKTYGFHKAMDRISSSQIAALTGIAPQHCRAAIRDLKARQVVREDGNKIGIQKDYDNWGGPNRAGPNRAEREAQIGPEGGPNRAGKEAQIGPYKRQKTLIKSKLASSLADELIFPEGFDAELREKAARIVAPLNGQAQTALDELAWNIQHNKIEVTPLACLRGICKTIAAGTDCERAAAIKAERERQRQPIKPAAQQIEEDAEAARRRWERLTGRAAPATPPERAQARPE